MAKVDYTEAVKRGDTRQELATIPKRTPTERLHEIALALATRRSDPLSKVELSLNAKGDVQISVDVTDPDPALAAKQAADLFDVLRTRYPRARTEARRNDARRRTAADRGTARAST